MYVKKLVKVLLLAIALAIFSALASYWIFEGSWIFLIFPLLTGAAMSFIQAEKISYKFLDKLIIGSFVYGFLTIFLSVARMYLILHPLNPTYPLSHYFNYPEFSMLALALAFVSFMGGLIGIVIKGFYFLSKQKTK